MMFEFRETDEPQTQNLDLCFPGRAADRGYKSNLASFNARTLNPSVDLSESETLDTLKGWLHQCSHNHLFCCSNRKHSPPTRLIWIGNENIRLVLTDELEQVPAYATLSYCWGLEPFLMLTSKTIDTFLIAIPECELPKTFRDAIFIARGLGMSYIWIDALCIIQRDSRDWHLEAGRMQSVYGGSEVTIAASSATNVHQGCFNRPINDVSGVFPEDMPWRSWEEVVERYSATMLTYSSDRLPALSGIASRQGEIREDEYFAGMWRENLLDQLLWQRRGDQPKKRPAWQAPTWSWASINQPVKAGTPQQLETRSLHIKVLDAWTEPSGPDSYGPVSGGELTLGCYDILCGFLDGDTNEMIFRPKRDLFFNAARQGKAIMNDLDTSDV
ncbi:HET-domain-containing protein [Apiospora saccharicola]|uniref:HET-domain-containing protein n=1 Tax=Apiospora saccharicola TaxID=335842 RepID=A0ABR1VBY9_9PEZI